MPLRQISLLFFFTNLLLGAPKTTPFHQSPAKNASVPFSPFDYPLSSVPTRGVALVQEVRHEQLNNNNSLIETGLCGRPTNRKNILLIVIDDLRPQINSFDVPFMVTPHMDSLAREGTIFPRTYVQISICSPTRNSFLSGRYPDKTATWNFIDDFRSSPRAGGGQSWTALPEFFRQNGYFTTGAGKVYHPKHPPKFDYPRSWSEPWYSSSSACSCNGTDKFPPRGQASCEGLKDSWNSCSDDDIVDKVIEQLQKAQNCSLGHKSQPFFIAAGLHKPHLSFYAKQKHFDLYRNLSLYNDLPPDVRNIPRDAPYVAWHSCLSRAEGDNFSDWGNFTDIPNRMTYENPMNMATAARLRRGYYGSVSYTDDNVGKLLAAVEPLRNDTIVLLIGDHGWSLGEQNLWCKMSTYENGMRVPLIIRAPFVPDTAGTRSNTLAEAVDLYRTLADLSGIGQDSIEKTVDGISLAGAMVAAKESLTIGDMNATELHNNEHLNTFWAKQANIWRRNWKPRTVAKSQFPRCYTALSNATLRNGSKLPQLDRTDCQDLPRETFDFMGYTIRTNGFRYVEWRHWIGENLTVNWNNEPAAIELYSHQHNSSNKDPFGTETINIANNPTFSNTLKYLRETLRNAFEFS